MNYTEKEKQWLSVIEANMQHYNNQHPDRLLTINKYVASGNRIDVLLNGRLLAGMLTPVEANYFIFGVVTYAETGANNG